MENDNKRKRPSQGLIDMMNGDWEKLEEERMKSCSYEPIDDSKLYNLDEVIKLCAKAWHGGEMFCATEGKVYGQSINFDEWLKENKLERLK